MENLVISCKCSQNFNSGTIETNEVKTKVAVQGCESYYITVLFQPIEAFQNADINWNIIFQMSLEFTLCKLDGHYSVVRGAGTLRN